MYDIRGKLVHNFLVIDFTTQGNIVECFFWGNGVVAMTSDMQIFVAEVKSAISSRFDSLEMTIKAPYSLLNSFCIFFFRVSPTWMLRLLLASTSYGQD
jgi:hypothetical protein